MSKREIKTEGAPKAVGPYSQAVVAGNWMFLSGQIPLDPATGVLAAQDIEGQTRQVLRNLDAVLAAAGIGRSNVVKTTIYLTNLADFSVVNGIYAEYFGDGVRPARATVQVAALPLAAMVEIDAVALVE